MAYDSETIARKIVDLKNGWQSAASRGDTAKSNEIAQKAQTYYKQLRDNGDNILADSLEARNNEQAQQYIDTYYKKNGKTAIRPYYYGLGQKYGLSNSDVDNLLTFDEDTGQVSLNGKNIGTPSAIVNGTSYWDTSKLDDAWNNYIQTSGTSRSQKDLVKQENENIANKYNDLYGMNIKDQDQLMEEIKKNPFTSDAAKSIYGAYNLDGINQGYNAAAATAASNGGNIDSYAAANAMRQQAALNYQGQQAVLDYYDRYIDNLADTTQSKTANAIAILEGMGVNVDRAWQQYKDQFDMDETAKNNDVSRNVAISEVTGYVPSKWDLSTNPYFDENGNLKNPDMDYQAIIEWAKENNDQTTYNNAVQARFAKVMSDPEKYKAYTDEKPLVSYGPLDISSVRESAKDRQNAYDLAKMGYDYDIEKTNLSNEAAINAANIEAETARQQALAEAEIAREQAASNERTAQIQANAQLESDKINAQTQKELMQMEIQNNSIDIQNEVDNDGNYLIDGTPYTLDEISEGLQDGSISKIQTDGNKVTFIKVKTPAAAEFMPTNPFYGTYALD